MTCDPNYNNQGGSKMMCDPNYNNQGCSKRSSVERETWKAGDFCVKVDISLGILRKKLFELKAGGDLPTCVQSCHVAAQHP